MFDSLRRNRHAADEMFDELESELRVAGVMLPTPQPSAERRAVLRAAVVAQRNGRSRAGVGGIRGAALGVAMVAGSGLVIASAAGGTNPVTFVTEVVREIPVPESRPESRERPVEPEPASAVASPETSPGGNERLAAAPTATPSFRSELAEPTPTAIRNVPTATSVAEVTTGPANTDTRPVDSEPALSAVKPVDSVRPTATPASNTDAAIVPAKPTATRTPEPTATPTATPKASVDAVPFTNTWTSPTATPTPVPIRPKTTSNATDSLTTDQSETNELAGVDPK